MTLKEQMINGVISIEGGYVNNTNDSGGETNYGITVAVARENGYTGEMINLPRETAFNIYSRKYWNTIEGDDLAGLSEMIATEVFDTAVNMGHKIAGTFLQRSLNLFNNKQSYYPDITVDGKIGKMTISALFDYLKKRDEKVLFKCLNSLQGAFYIELAERREKDETFIYGWFKHRIEY